MHACMYVCIGKPMVYRGFYMWLQAYIRDILNDIPYRQENNISLFKKIPHVCYLSLNMNIYLELSDM